MSSDFTPHMTPGEIKLLKRYIPSNGRVLEFGCGGSTQLFFEHDVRHVVSVESDKAWLENLLSSPVVRTYLRHKRWTPVYASIGPTQNWGAPKDTTPAVRWLNYHQYCWDLFEDHFFDLILVDGRFRVACVCQALLRCVNEQSIICIHDFSIRETYKQVLEFLEIVDKEDTLWIFKPASQIDWKKLCLTLQDNQFDVM